MASSPSADDEQQSIDASEPFRGVVVCCTSIPPEQRTDIANKVAELGGVHKYDLTPDATHLVVGDYDTLKYRHVARERQDVKAMDAAWIEAVLKLWRNDDELDFARLEREYQLKPLEKCGADPSSPGGGSATRQSLLICLTGFGDQRDEIAQMIESNGGRFTPDLTRKCTHLIVSKPEGRKFTAAKSWNVWTVTMDWLHQSIARGMILEEVKFDPLLPAEDQGVGAWVKKDLARASLGKRTRSTTANSSEEGGRKLRKTASMKLSSQRNNLWVDILGNPTSRDNTITRGLPEEPTQQASQSNPAARQEDPGVFSGCVFATYGFDQRRQKLLEETIATLGGAVAPSLEAATSYSAGGEPSHRFLVVPQSSQPDAHPHISSDVVHIVTEFYIERCLHNKRFSHPSEHVLGRPFPLFPIFGFSELTICSAAFKGLELSQVARSVAQLGAKFEEEFRPTTSLVVCRSLQGMRREKLRYALEWGVPVVSAEWLWECISTGFNVPLPSYIFPELQKQYAAKNQRQQTDKKQPGKASQRKCSEPTATVRKPGASRLPAEVGLDATAFDPESSAKKGGKESRRPVIREDSTTSADFMTVRTQRADKSRMDSDTPVSEPSCASLNKSLSPPKRAAGSIRTRSEPTAASVVDKTTVARRGPSAPPLDKSERAREADAEQGNREAEEEARRRKEAKAAERQFLSSKLSSLIQSTTDPDGRDSRTQAPPPRTRRRQILGRAISNASSAASVDGGCGSRPAPESLRVTAPGSDEDAPLQPPPATQLEYRDPQVLECKAALVQKMEGGSGSGSGSGRVGRTPLAVMGGGVDVGVPSGRTLRKR